jgi:hypothetical protein
MGSATSKFPSNFSCAVVVAAPPPKTMLLFTLQQPVCSSQLNFLDTSCLHLPPPKQFDHPFFAFPSLSGSWHRVKVVGSELCWVLIAWKERKQASKQRKVGTKQV